RPAHVESLLFSQEANFDNIAAFLNSNIQGFIESIASAQPILKWGFVTFFLIGIVKRFRNTGKSNFPIYIVAVSLLLQITASLFELYPFGSIRYTTFLLPFFILLYLEGVYFLIGETNKLGKIIFVGLATILIVFTSYIQLNSIAAKYEQVNNAYKRENVVIQELHTVAENNDIYCDIVSEKVVKAYRHNCLLVSTWNLTRNLGESEEFYSEFEFGLANKTELHFMLYKNISIQHFDSMRRILKNNEFELTQELHAAFHLYSYRKL
ncbi:MAG: hypothetical protein ACJA2E_000504, partial [Arenicella sp.]